MSESDFGKLDIGSTSAQTEVSRPVAQQAPPSYYEAYDANGDNRPPPVPEKTSAFAVRSHNDSSAFGLSSTYYATPGAQNPGEVSTSRSFSPISPLSTPGPSVISPISSPNNLSLKFTPPQFARPPPSGLPYTSFKPIFAVARGATLDKGFHHVPPPSDGSKPHPFVTHDVEEADWLSFLDMIALVATLSEKDISRSWLPIVSAIPVLNFVIAAGVQKVMKSRKGVKAARLIDSWNHHFFEPRKLRIILMKGQTKLNGLTELLPASGAGALANPAPNVPSCDDIYRLFVVPIE